MPRNEDGEFELILGNRQLLSVFFIVVILLGVFFTMGYIVGRNSGPGGTEVAAREPASPARITASEPPTRTEPAQQSTPAPSAVKSEPKAEGLPQAETAKQEPPKPETPVKPQVSPAGALAAVDPVAGATYLQLAAVNKPEAEMLVEVATRKGFSAIHSPVKEKPGLFRVLVGPLKDAGAIAETRNKLNEAGLPGNEAVKRVF
jgi:cytoskeletal protein RodZ